LAKATWAGRRTMFNGWLVDFNAAASLRKPSRICVFVHAANPNVNAGILSAECTLGRA
jgi:hypothetical protein